MRGATKGDYLSRYEFGVSIHAPRAGRDLIAGLIDRRALWFQSTRPVRGATCSLETSGENQSGFNPRAPCGARRGVGGGWIFSSRLFQSTRPVRGATSQTTDESIAYDVSIHAPRAGRDI